MPRLTSDYPPDALFADTKPFRQFGRRLAPRLRNLCLALLVFLATAVPVYAEGDDPPNQGFGLAYDTLLIDVLGYSPLVEGQTQAMVVWTRWSDRTVVQQDAGALVLIIHWPRNEGDTARAQDAVAFAKVEDRGLAILAYDVPSGVLLPGEQMVTATVEISALAFTMQRWPSAGWGATKFDIAVGRAE
jgi:hypothetical protein